MKEKFFFLLIFFIFEIIKTISCISRNLKYLEEKCILNDFYSKSNIIITFNVTEGDFKEHEIKGPRFVINVYNKKTNKLKQSFETQKTYGKFSFNVKKTGHYKICIIGKDEMLFGQQKFIIFDMNIETSLEVQQKVSETANFKDFEKVNHKMQLISDKVEQIENMQLLAKNVENTFSKNQINSSKRIAWISVLQIVIIFILGSYNVYAIQDAFKNKMTMPF